MAPCRSSKSVFSRTLPAAAYPGVRVVNDDPRGVVSALKKEPGRDIWLFGGGELFRTLLSAGLVDSVEVAVMPVLIGEGIPLLPPGGTTTLTLVDHKILPKSGVVILAYSVPGGAGAPSIGFIKAPKARAKKGAAKATVSEATKKKRWQETHASLDCGVHQASPRRVRRGGSGAASASGKVRVSGR